MNTETPPPAIQLPLVRDPGLLPVLEMDGYLTGVLVTPHLETSQWIMGLWRDLPVTADNTRIKQGLATAMAHRKTIEANFAKGWPGFLPGFCKPGEKGNHDKVRTWVRGFWSAMKLAPNYWTTIAEDERTATFVALFTGFMDIGEPFEEREDADEIRDEHAALLPRALVGMRKLALMREDKKPALRAMQTGKLGRNEQCPCGSGKKYKRCCVAI
jgi:uncharacterized protein